MSKGLKNFPNNVRKEVIARRLEHPQKGLGTIAAQDAAYLEEMKSLREKVVKNPGG